MRKHLTALFAVFTLLLGAMAAQADQKRVLWWDGSPPYDGATNRQDREAMARYIGSFNGGADYSVTFQHSTRRGDLAAALAGASYDILVLDVTTTSANFTNADLNALRGHYQSGKRALMLDGTLWVRNARPGPMTLFPGPNGASAALLMNQMQALADAGGGILIGTDHTEFQVGANQLLGAILPQARFSGRTNPSRDGAFLGNSLLNAAVAVKPFDILRHWEEIPSQAEVPVGQFTDFTGAPVTLHALVETSDKPGGRAKRPYISASFDPGEGRTAIDSQVDPEPVKDYMPTRKSLGN
ncbi:hypothetical protein [Roseobacter weihaiensis]|uniref:hypothetical protein n=1 Tax=Roseobacter weihaiensis TaxID=2763262 RepID=UPI001D0B81FD|nr:hypothetical protein [Roseobacter sp. H9]